MDGKTDPETRVEDLAARYLRDIQIVQPQGPYLLGGHSFGAGVALELSNQLRLQGQQVARLCIFDSTVPLDQPIGTDLDEAQWLADITRILERLLDRRLALSLANFRQPEPQGQLDLLHETLETNDWTISKRQLHGLVRTFKANCQALYIPRG